MTLRGWRSGIIWLWIRLWIIAIIDTYQLNTLVMMCGHPTLTVQGMNRMVENTVVAGQTGTWSGSS